MVPESMLLALLLVLLCRYVPLLLILRIHVCHGVHSVSFSIVVTKTGPIQ